MKKIALLFTIVCAGQLFGMEPIKTDYMAMLPREVKGLVVLALVRSGTLEEAINALRALIETNQEFNLMINDPIIIRAIIHILAQKFNAPSEYVAQQLSTAGSEQYIALSKKLITALWRTEDFASAESLINAGADIDFQTADTYPMHCGSSDELNPTVIAGLHELAAVLPILIEIQQVTANVKQIVFKKWPKLYIYRKKEPKFLEKEAEDIKSVIIEMSEFRKLSEEDQKQKLLTSKKYSQQLLAHFQEDLQAGQSNAQAIIQSLNDTFPNNKQWKKLSEKISKGKFQEALNIVSSQHTTKDNGILVFLATETDTCIIGANFSLIMYAIASNRPAILEWLINHNANLNLTMSTGDSALLMAMSMGKKDMVELLIDNGANVNQRSTLNEEINKMLRKLGRIEIHLALLNMYFNATNHSIQFYYDLSLYRALNIGELGSIMANAIMISGGTPLIRLTLMLINKKFKDEEFNALLKLLLSKGANLNTQTSYGDTTLITLAVIDGHADAMQLLLDHGADPAIKNEEGMTALDYMKSEIKENDPERDEKIHLLEEAMKKQQK